jgi:hypothetical protein
MPKKGLPITRPTGLTLLGLGLATPKTRGLAVIGSIGYIGYLGSNVIRNG